MASTTFRLFTRRQFQYCSAPNHSYAGGLASFLLYSTKSKPPTAKMSLPKVFFDMAADNEPLGRITIEVSGSAIIFFPSRRFRLPNAFAEGAYRFLLLSSHGMRAFLSGWNFYHSETLGIDILLFFLFLRASLRRSPDALTMTGMIEIRKIVFDLYGICSSYILVSDIYNASIIFRQWLPYPVVCSVVTYGWNNVWMTPYFIAL